MTASRVKLSGEDVQHSMRWFARQPESAPFFAALHGILAEIGPTDTCALHAHNERRKFASDLIAMAEAEKRDGPEDEFERRNGPRAAPRKTRRHGPAGR